MRLKLIQSGPTINTESQNLQRVLSLAEKILFHANFIVMCRAYSNALIYKNLGFFSLRKRLNFDSGLIPLNP